jgi:hypothetical protein
MNSTPIAWLLVVLSLLAAFWLLRALMRSRAQNEVADPRRQLDFVSKVIFETRPLFNRGEYQVLLVLEAVVRDLDAGHRVMAQTCLGEFLRPKSTGPETNLAFRSINSKRVDFLIVDEKGIAVLVVEYQGQGHYQGTAELRDAVKKEAFRTAGIALIEVLPKFDRASLSRDVRNVLQRTEGLKVRLL